MSEWRGFVLLNQFRFHINKYMKSFVPVPSSISIKAVLMQLTVILALFVRLWDSIFGDKIELLITVQCRNKVIVCSFK